MSDAHNRQLHIPPEKIEIEDRSCEFTEKERTSDGDVDALKVEVAELKASLGKKEAENKLIAFEKYTLEASKKKIESAKDKLEAYAKRRLVKYREADEQKQAKIDAAQVQNSELNIVLAKKTAESKQIAQEKDALEAENKKIRREKKELEVFTKKKLATTKEKYSKVLQERNDKLKQSKVKLEAAYEEISKLKSLLAQKQTENKHITDENDVLEAKYKKSKTDKKELEVYVKRKLETTKHKYQKVLQERNVMLKQKQNKIDALDRHNRR